MGKTLAVNAGSSTLKFKLFEVPSEKVITSGVIERIGLKDSIVTIKYGDGQKFENVQDVDDHEQAINLMLDKLIELKIIANYNEITGVGHRVVAGGEFFTDSVLVTMTF
jgi:Acetate kinase